MKVIQANFGHADTEQELRNAAAATTTALFAYAETLDMWADRTATAVFEKLDKHQTLAWIAEAREESPRIAAAVKSVPVGQIHREFLWEQSKLIKSLPRKAAIRAAELVRQSIEEGLGVPWARAEIFKLGGITIRRAQLIARTETARFHSSLIQVRSLSLGVEGYIWRSHHDERVRESHEEMDGKYVKWMEKPTLSDKTTTHAGQIYNCRCIPIPVIPETNKGF